MAKLQDKERILKAAREKQEVTCKGAPIKLAVDFSMETLQARKEWQKIFQVMRTRGLEPRLLYPAKLSIKIEGQIKSFTDKMKSKRIHLHQTSSARDAKGTALRKGRKRERKRNTGRNKGNEQLPIDNNLNVNGLNAPIKRHRIAECIRKHDPPICCLKETHHRTKDVHRLKVKGWKQILQANGQGKKVTGEKL